MWRLMEKEKVKKEVGVSGTHWAGVLGAGGIRVQREETIGSRGKWDCWFCL